MKAKSIYIRKSYFLTILKKIGLKKNKKPNRATCICSWVDAEDDIAGKAGKRLLEHRLISANLGVLTLQIAKKCKKQLFSTWLLIAYLAIKFEGNLMADKNVKITFKLRNHKLEIRKILSSFVK